MLVVMLVVTYAEVEPTLTRGRSTFGQGRREFNLKAWPERRQRLRG